MRNENCIHSSKLPNVEITLFKPLGADFKGKNSLPSDGQRILSFKRSPFIYRGADDLNTTVSV